MNDDIAKQLNEGFPGYNQLAFESRISQKVVGHIAFVSPSGEFIQCPFALPVEDARSAGTMKKLLHEVVEKVLRHGITMGRKVNG